MVNNNSQEKRALALVVIGCCIASILFDGASLDTQNLRRSLMTVEMPESKLRFLAGDDDDNSGLYPWARQHLRPVDVVPEPEKETVLFWHIPKR